MTNPSNIEIVVRKRIQRMRVLRFVFSNTLIAVVIAVAALWGIGREVWVAKVFANGPQDVFGQSVYMSQAFFHTRFVVQALVLGVVAAFITLAREATSALAKFVSPALVH